MKILHLCLGDRFVDGYSYQANMLVKFHKKMGLDVEVIASQDGFDSYGRVIHSLPTGSYIGEYNVKILRVSYKHPNIIYYKLKQYAGLQKALESSHPDYLFIHNCQFLDIKQVIKYLKKHPETIVYVDNHADYSNSATNFFSKKILHGFLWKRCAKQIEPYTRLFYGVLPARVDFLKNVYGLPPEKCELLVMGADDDLVEKAKNNGARERIRGQYGIKDDDFLIMTGGKIDQWKTQTLLLMQAVRNIPNEHLKLIVFGSVTQELSQQVNELADGTRIQYIGWLQAKDTYEYVEAADLFVFPGRHSVFWEQVAGQGKPMIVKDWPGTHHVDLGGNVIFLKKDSVQEIQAGIESILNNPDKFSAMQRAAAKGISFFSYSDISNRAIEL